MPKTRTGLLISDKSLKNLDGRKMEAKILRGIIRDLEDTIKDVNSPKRRLVERAAFVIYRVSRFEYLYLTGQPMTADDERIYQSYCKLLHSYLVTLGLENRKADIIDLPSAFLKLNQETNDDSK